MAEDNTKAAGAEANAPASTAQGAEMVKHTVTDADIKHNPDLAKKGVKVGDEIDLPKDVKAAADARASEAAAKTANATASKSKAKPAKHTVVTPFADKDNFGKMWKEGDDVSHFDEARLADCVSRGLVKKG